MPLNLDVILATNRHSAFLEETVASVAGQQGVDCNLVIVDDGSPAPELLRSCVANIPRATVVRQKHAGLSSARNRGLRECEGPFVAFLDDDDVWHPLKSAKQLEAFRLAPTAVACACWGSYVNDAGKVIGSWAPAGLHSSRDYIARDAVLPRIVTLLFRREVCDAIGGFDERVALVEDIDFIFRVLLRGECTAVEDRLVGYRQHSSNISHGVGTITRDAFVRMFLKLIRLSEEAGDGESAELFRQQLAHHRRQACTDSLRELRASLRARSRQSAVAEARWLAGHLGWWPEALSAKFGRDPL